MVILRHRLPGGWLRSVEDRFQGPEISMAHDLAERLFDLQERGCRPARRHSRTPAAHPAGAIANSRMWIVYDVASGQTTMQRAWNIEPIDGEAFLQSFQQCRRGLGIVALQPSGDLVKLGHTLPRFIFQAARISDAVCACCSRGSRPSTLRSLWFLHLWTGISAPNTALIAVRSAFEPSMMNKRVLQQILGGLGVFGGAFTQ